MALAMFIRTDIDVLVVDDLILCKTARTRQAADELVAA
jgi:hypothetical protein